MHRGFILQSTYRIEAAKPVVMIYGKLEQGGSFLIRDTRQAPSFYVRAQDADRARLLGAEVCDDDPPWTTLLGEPAARIVARAPQDIPPLREKLTAAGVECFEADVPFASRYLIDRGIRGSVEIRGEHRQGEPPCRRLRESGSVACGLDTEPFHSLLRHRDGSRARPACCRLLSQAAGHPRYCFTVPAGYSRPAGAVSFAGEKELLEAFIRRVIELDPDILTGWNVVDFDLAALFADSGAARRPPGSRARSGAAAPPQIEFRPCTEPGADSGQDRARRHRTAARRLRAAGKLFAGIGFQGDPRATERPIQVPTGPAKSSACSRRIGNAWLHTT